MSYEISKAARKVISDEGLLCKLDEFTDEEIAQLCNYSRALHTTTDFDDEVERELEKLEAEKQRRPVNPGSPFEFNEAT
jgi:chromosome segregation ATPase